MDKNIKYYRDFEIDINQTSFGRNYRVNILNLNTGETVHSIERLSSSLNAESEARRWIDGFFGEHEEEPLDHVLFEGKQIDETQKKFSYKGFEIWLNQFPKGEFYAYGAGRGVTRNDPETAMNQIKIIIDDIIQEAKETAPPLTLSLRQSVALELSKKHIEKGKFYNGFTKDIETLTDFILKL